MAECRLIFIIVFKSKLKMEQKGDSESYSYIKVEVTPQEKERLKWMLKYLLSDTATLNNIATIDKLIQDDCRLIVLKVIEEVFADSEFMTSQIFIDFCFNVNENVGKLLKHKKRQNILASCVPYNIERYLGMKTCLIMGELISLKLKETAGSYEAPVIYSTSGFDRIPDRNVFNFNFGVFTRKEVLRERNDKVIKKIGNVIINELCELHNIGGIKRMESFESVEFFFNLL